LSYSLHITSLWLGETSFWTPNRHHWHANMGSHAFNSQLSVYYMWIPLITLLSNANLAIYVMNFTTSQKKVMEFKLYTLPFKCFGVVTFNIYFNIFQCNGIINVENSCASYYLFICGNHDFFLWNIYLKQKSEIGTKVHSYCKWPQIPSCVTLL